MQFVYMEPAEEVKSGQKMGGRELRGLLLISSTQIQRRDNEERETSTERRDYKAKKAQRREQFE